MHRIRTLTELFILRSKTHHLTMCAISSLRHSQGGLNTSSGHVQNVKCCPLKRRAAQDSAAFCVLFHLIPHLKSQPLWRGSSVGVISNIICIKQDWRSLTMNFHSAIVTVTRLQRKKKKFFSSRAPWSSPPAAADTPAVSPLLQLLIWLLFFCSFIVHF